MNINHLDEIGIEQLEVRKVASISNAIWYSDQWQILELPDLHI